MVEIKRLRTRLKNVSKNVNSYSMTITEARNLLEEIDDLLTQIELSKVEDGPVDTPTLYRVLDGGTF